jgi:biopolymer transport protein ExbB
MDFIVSAFQKGGPLMYVNLGVLVFAVSLIAERLYMILFRYRMNSKAFLTEVEKAIQAGNLDKAKRLCTSQTKPVLPRVIQAALSNVRLGSSAVASAVDESMAEVSPLVTKRTSMLWAIANIATLIGLVGTVVGLIQAFGAIALASPEQKATMLTQGISHAMNNTAFGLSIALVCIVFHMTISNLAKSLIEQIEFGAIRIQNLLSRLQTEKALQRSAAGGEAQG